MATSKKRKGRGSGVPKSERDYQGPSSRASSPVKPPMTPVDIPAPAPASTLSSARHEAPKLRRAASGKFLIPAATVGLLGGGAYAASRYRRRNAVTKSLFNPITGEETLFSKAVDGSGRRYERDYYSHSGRGISPAHGYFDDTKGKASRRIQQRGHEEGKGGAKVGGGVGLAGGAFLGGRLARSENKHQNVMRGYDRLEPLSRKARLARGGKYAAVGGALAGAYGAASGYVVGEAGGRDSQIQREVARSRRKDRVGKAVSGPRGANLPDRVMGASTPMIGQTRVVGMLVPTGSHVSHANDLSVTRGKRVNKQPIGRNAQRLLHVKGKSRGSRRGKLVVASKADTGLHRLGFADVDRSVTFGRQTGRRGARIA